MLSRLLKRRFFDRMYVFEGLDGAGKSTQIKLISTILKSYGFKVKAFSSPGNTIFGKFVRKYRNFLNKSNRSRMYLYDYLIQLNQMTSPSYVYLWDRYKDSGIVSNRDMTFEESVRWMSVLAEPRLCFFIDIKPSDILSHRVLNDPDAFNLNWQSLKYERYSRLISYNPNQYVVIDGRSSIDYISSIICKKILLDLS